MVEALLAASTDAFANDAKSIDCPYIVVHPTPRLPLWTIAYWAEALSLHKTCAPWVLAKEALYACWRASIKKPKT
jgi:hypothetical protein